MIAELVEHARRFGPEGVLYTAIQQGLSDDDLLKLAAELDTLRIRKNPKEKPLSLAKLNRQVQNAHDYIN